MKAGHSPGPMVDNDYVLFFTGTPPHPAPSARRARALEQWNAVRADVEYGEAVASSRAAAAQRRPLWQLMLQRNPRGWPRAVEVTSGEALDTCGVLLTDPPPARAMLPVDGVPRRGDLCDALVCADTDALLTELQPADPLSWHCETRALQHSWFCHQRERPGLPSGLSSEESGGGSQRPGMLGRQPAAETAPSAHWTWRTAARGPRRTGPPPAVARRGSPHGAIRRPRRVPRPSQCPVPRTHRRCAQAAAQRHHCGLLA